jgi:putative SOS response-associated peptidase YedK
MAEIHNTRQREPAIVRPSEHSAWLAGDAQHALQLLRSTAGDELQAWRVSRRVNSPRNQGPELVREEAPRDVEPG